jgi:hypothetical protein
MPMVREELRFELAHQLGMFVEIGPRIVATLTDALAAHGVPGATLLDEVELDVPCRPLPPNG